MLDRKLIIQNPDLVRENCRRRGVQCDVDQIVLLEGERLKTLQLAEDLNRQANATSKLIPKAQDDAQRTELIEKGRELRQRKETANRQHDEFDEQIKCLQLSIPNLTHPEVPSGGEQDAKELSFGKTPKTSFDFKT